MKNIFKITFALLFAITIPSGIAYASLSSDMQGYVEAQQIQGIINGLSGISDAINAQTRALQVAQKQQQLAALDQKCVNDSVANIMSQETYIKETDKAIEEYQRDYMDPTKNNMSDPSYSQQTSSHLNYLYKLRARQSDLYFGYIIDWCTNYKPQLTCPAGYYWDANTGKRCITPNQQCIEFYGSNATLHNYDVATNKLSCDCVAGTVWNSTQTACVSQQTTVSLQCNGKAWLACPAGQRFYCPASGDPQCIVDEAPVVTIPTTKNIQPSTEVQKPTSNIEQVKSEPTTSTNITPAPASTYHKGLIPRFWSWFTGLFGL
jgi:hypothetical protein